LAAGANGSAIPTWNCRARPAGSNRAARRVPLRPRDDHGMRAAFASSWRYVLNVPEDPITEELKLSQLEREQAERRRADSVPDEDEAAQHKRRADKAKYLAEKLEERAESERRRGD